MSLEHAAPEPEEMNEIEAALASLRPARGRIDRDLVMYLAGQSSNRPARSTIAQSAWMAIAASLALVASGEGVMLALRPSPGVIERIVVREPADPAVGPTVKEAATPVKPPGPSQPARSRGPGPTAHERLADQVLRYGLDGLPQSPRVSLGDPETRPAFSRQQLFEEMRKTLLSGDPS